MTEISNLTLKLSRRPLRASYSALEAPNSGELSPLVDGDLAYTSWAQGPAGTSNQEDPTTVPLVEAISISGVDTTATAVEVYWRRPGVVGQMRKLGDATDQGGGTWSIAAGFDAVIFEDDTDHGSFPWNDVDFLVKIISPEGVFWGSWIDVGISFVDLTPASGAQDSSYGFDPLTWSDCITLHSGGLDGYYFSPVTDLNWAFEDGGQFTYWIDYEGNWNQNELIFLQGTDGTELQIIHKNSLEEIEIKQPPTATVPGDADLFLGNGFAWPSGTNTRAQVKIDMYHDGAGGRRSTTYSRTIDGDKPVDVSADPPNHYAANDTEQTDSAVSSVNAWNDLSNIIVGGDTAATCFTGNVRELVIYYTDEFRSVTLFEFRADEVTDYDGSDGGTFTDGQGNTWAVNLIGSGSSNGICFTGG